MTIAAALAGHGIARPLSDQVANDVRAGRLVILLAKHEPLPLPIHVAHDGGASARVRAFIDHAVSELRADRRLDPGEP